MSAAWHSIPLQFFVSCSPPSGVIDEGGSREHAFGLITSQRSFHLTAETDEERRYYTTHICYHSDLTLLYRYSEWVEVIRRVRGMPEAKVKSLLVHEVDPRNAQGTVEMDVIDSVTASDQEKK